MQSFGADDHVFLRLFLLGLDRAHTKSSGLTSHPFYGAAKDHERSEIMGAVQDLIAAKKLCTVG